MYERILNNKQYIAISKGIGGIEIRVPRYIKTETYIGSPKEARKKGYKVQKGGSRYFYFVDNDVPVVKGYIAKPTKKFYVEIKIPKTVTLSETGLVELTNEINLLSNMFYDSLTLQ